jgi:hypothetical protein
VLLAVDEASPEPAGATGLEAVDFADQESRPWRATSPARLGDWRVHHVNLAGAVGALATESGPWRLRYESLPGGPR